MFKNRFLFALLPIIAALTPLAAFAAPRDLRELSQLFLGIFDTLVAPIIGVAALAFVWGVILIIVKGDDTKAHSDGLKIVSFGIIALFVMVAVWGLVAVLQSTFGV